MTSLRVKSWIRRYLPWCLGADKCCRNIHSHRSCAEHDKEAELLWPGRHSPAEIHKKTGITRKFFQYFPLSSGC